MMQSIYQTQLELHILLWDDQLAINKYENSQCLKSQNQEV